MEIEKENKNAEERENGKRSGKKGKHKKIKWHGDKKRKKDRWSRKGKRKKNKKKKSWEIVFEIAFLLE